jgi:HSP20 family protein
MKGAPEWFGLSPCTQYLLVKGGFTMRRDLDLWRGERSPFSLFNEMDRLFSQFNRPTEGNESLMSFAPACDIEELDDHFLISVDVPGMKREDLKIEVVDNRLVISGERRDEREWKEGRRNERFYGKFERSFQLPTGVDFSKIEANYENGVLELAVPKAESAKPRTIQIHSGKDEGFLGRFLGRKPGMKEAKTNDSSRAS